MSLLIDKDERSFSLSSLLPYDTATKKNGKLIPALHEYCLLITTAEQAIDALESGSFEQFDALGGENMCQIRAIIIATIAKALLKSLLPLKSRLATIKGKVDSLSKSLASRPQGSLKDLFDKEHLDVTLTYKEVFLAQAYLLTQVKVEKPSRAETPFLANEGTEPKNLQKFGKVSSSFASALVKNFRKGLSSASVEFIRECARALPEKEELAPTIVEELVVEHNGCRSLPFFFVNDILMRQAFSSSIPIIINLEQVAKDQGNKKIRQICLLFKRNSNERQRTIIPSVHDLNSPAFVLHGFMQRPLTELPDRMQTIRELLSYGVDNLVLMNSADHRQCLDPSKERLVQTIGNQKLKSYKAAAQERGCSLENPSLFFINHAFCGSIGHQPSLKRKTEIATELGSIQPNFTLPILETIAEYEEEP